MIFLQKYNAFFYFDSSQNKNNCFNTIEGFRKKTRQKFTGRQKTSFTENIRQRLFELKILLQEIGIFNIYRLLRYSKSPKVIYVDILKLQYENKVYIYEFEQGISLRDCYLSDEIKNKGILLKELNNSLIANTYNIHEILKKSEKIQKAKITQTNNFNNNTNNNWYILGTGNFAASVLVPSIINSGGKLVGCCSNSGASSYYLSKAFNIPYVFDSVETMLNSSLPVQNILIATPPTLHPEHIRMAIKAKLKIYTEKPVAIDYNGLDELKILTYYKRIMVGFNRRFSPAVQKLSSNKTYKSERNNICVSYTVNLGEFSVGMATKDIGGGTTVGSCCHYLDLIEYLCCSEISSFSVFHQEDNNKKIVYGFSFVCALKMTNGNIASLVFKRSLVPSVGVKEHILVIGEKLNAEIIDFNKIRINKYTKRFIKYTKGWRDAMSHFHKHDEFLDSSTATTLETGCRITRFAMEIDKEIEKSL